MTRSEDIVQLAQCLPSTQYVLGLIPSTQRWRQLDQLFKVIPGSIASVRPVWDT